MTGFLASLGGKLAERWLSRLALPGLLYVAFFFTGLMLGHEHAIDRDRIERASTGLLDELKRMQPGALAATAFAGLLGTALAGIGAQVLGRLVRALWFRPGWKWTARRSVMGGRMRTVERRVSDFYGLDLTLVWPRLWLVLSPQVRGELRATVSALDSAMMISAWGLGYLLLGALWWPSAAGGAVAYATGWFLARERTADLAALVEATVDIGLRPVARSLGVTPPQAVTPGRFGALISPFLHKPQPLRPRAGTARPSGPPVRSRRE